MRTLFSSDGSFFARGKHQKAESVAKQLRYSPLLVMVQAGADAVITHVTHLVDELIG